MNKNLQIFIITIIVVWAIGTLVYIYSLPNIIYNGIYKLVMNNGVSPSGIPLNTLYTVPTLGSPSSNSFLVNTGANHDTLYTAGILDLSTGPEILHVPNISGRYYVIELVDSRGNVFAEIGTGTIYHAGNYLISGHSWNGQVPDNITQIVSPNNKVFLIGRVLVKNDSDVPNVYNISKQIQLTPLNG